MIAKSKQEIVDGLESEIPMLKRYAFSLSRDFAQAEDLVQECMARAIARIDSWQAGTNLQAWLVVILRNIFYNDRRRVKRERLSLSALRLHAPQIYSPQESRAILRNVEDAYTSLSPEQREVLTLIAIRGMTYKQTAALVGANVGTVKSRLSRARTRLHQLMDDCDIQPQSDDQIRDGSLVPTAQVLH